MPVFSCDRCGEPFPTPLNYPQEPLPEWCPKCEQEYRDAEAEALDEDANQ